MVPIGTTATVVLSLTVSDSAGATANDEVTITIDSADVLVFLASQGDPNIEELYAYDTKTATLTRLSEESTTRIDDFTLSPDGKFVTDLRRSTPQEYSPYIARTDGSDLRQIATVASELPNRGISFVFWSPDSSRIAFRTQEPIEPFEQRLLSVLPDGSGLVTLASRTGAAVSISFDRGAVSRSGPWAPDSSRILLREYDGTTTEYFTVRPDGTDLVSIASGFVDFLDAIPEFYLKPIWIK